MAKEKILVVDDEEDLVELVRYNLEREGYGVVCVGTGEDALTAARDEGPELIILDLMLPGVDGLDVCKELKRDEKTRHIPVVMLTAKTEDSDIVSGLELGADDYITKPFSPRVLLARVKAALRRKKPDPEEETGSIFRGDLTINPARREVRAAGQPIALTATEFNILHFLATRPGWVFSRDQIISAVKGDDYPVTERSVDVQIAGLRRKLGDTGEVIETVRGVGYRFRE